MVWDGPMSNVLGLPLLGVLGSLYRPSPPAVPSARFDLKRAPPRAPPQHARENERRGSHAICFGFDSGQLFSTCGRCGRSTSSEHLEECFYMDQLATL